VKRSDPTEAVQFQGGHKRTTLICKTRGTEANTVGWEQRYGAGVKGTVGARSLDKCISDGRGSRAMACGDTKGQASCIREAPSYANEITSKRERDTRGLGCPGQASSGIWGVQICPCRQSSLAAPGLRVPRSTCTLRRGRFASNGRT
jgi:hypothetical protein